MKLYYEIHVYVSRKNGYSVVIKIDNAIEHLDDDAVILEAVNQGVLDSEDSGEGVVTEITEEQYNLMILI